MERLYTSDQEAFFAEAQVDSPSYPLYSNTYGNGGLQIPGVLAGDLAIQCKDGFQKKLAEVERGVCHLLLPIPKRFNAELAMWPRLLLQLLDRVALLLIDFKTKKEPVRKVLDYSGVFFQFSSVQVFLKAI